MFFWNQRRKAFGIDQRWNVEKDESSPIQHHSFPNLHPSKLIVLVKYCATKRSALNASFGLLRLLWRAPIRTLYFLKKVVVTFLRTITLSPPVRSLWIERALLHTQLKFTFRPLSRAALSWSKSNLSNSRYLVDFICFV